MDDKVVSLSGTGMGLFEAGIGGDIFKDGPSPGLVARWKEMEDAIELYPSLSYEQKHELLEKYPEISCEVRCPECRRDF